MAVRQYIGARYVTKVYENSQTPGSAEWESGVEYEPLTLVTYLNSSYLSKKTVPVTVGNPAENTAYWVRTGYYNGQIASLQEQINDLNLQLESDVEEINETIKTVGNGKIDEFSNRKFLFISDSYDTLEEGAVNISDVCASYGNWNYVKISRGGYGFTGKYRNNQQWESLLPAVEDKDTFTDVVVFGGLNDMTASENEISTAMTSFNNYVKANFTNVKRIYCGFNGWANYNFTMRKNARAVYDIYKNLIPSMGWNMLNGLEFVSRDPANFRTSEDGVHPDSTAIPTFARMLYECITVGSCDYDSQFTINTSLNADYFGGNTRVYIFVHIHNGTCTVKIPRSSRTLLSTASGPFEITLLTTNNFKIPFPMPVIDADANYVPLSFYSFSESNEILNYGSLAQESGDSLKWLVPGNISNTSIAFTDLFLTFNL